MSNWFTIDKAGLAQRLEARGKSFAVFELVANAWDSGASFVHVTVEPVAGEPYAVVHVQDDGRGFENLEDARTFYGRSTSAGDPEKRGRFALGEKLALAVCRKATIATTTGEIHFRADGLVERSRRVTDRGTTVVAEMRMTRGELDALADDVARLVPPVPTTFNGQTLGSPFGKPIRTFEAKLPTVGVREDGTPFPTTRTGRVDVWEGDGSEGLVLEMGIPVVAADVGGYRVNVLQKVPLNTDRDNVSPSFLKALRVAVLNAVAADLSDEQAAEPWVTEAVADPRAQAPAVQAVVEKRFGDRAVVASPDNPLANAAAEAAGFKVVHGGSLPSGAWANVRKIGGLLPASSRVFPQAPAAVAAARADQAAKSCPMCGRDY
jgi:hypothetical protein